MQINKAPLKQARPLSVKEVQALEELTVDPAVPTLSVMAGFFMFCVMNCCRFSDAQWAQHMELDSTGSAFVLQSGTQKSTKLQLRLISLLLSCLLFVLDMRSSSRRRVKPARYDDTECAQEMGKVETRAMPRRHSLSSSRRKSWPDGWFRFQRPKLRYPN